MLEDEYIQIVLSHVNRMCNADITLDLLPPELQLKIRKAADLLKRLRSIKHMIDYTSQKRRKFFTIRKEKYLHEEEEYKFIYERLEKEYSTLLNEIVSDIKICQ